jgi:diguanylate cyclase (GGDEF)-like protein
MLIGRTSGAAVRFTDPGIAPVHARLVVDGTDVWLEDLVSPDGTVRSDPATRLEDGDYLRLGDQTVAKFALMSTLEERALRELRESALRDPLTRLYNRRYLDERLRSEFSFAQRHRSLLSVMLIDIDHFKRVNDQYGHQAGDLVLRVVAKALQRLTRPEDVVARFGGEEFVVVGRGLTPRNAMILSERIRRCVADLWVPLAEPPVTVTVSIGVATAGAGAAPTSAEDLIATADRAMYAAKTAGRNRVR